MKRLMLQITCIFLLIPGLVAGDPLLEIPYKKYVLDNGLTLLIHEDHKAPIVSVNIWYHVGSKNEKPGRTGFAHLFEHLMFNGSENFNDDWFSAVDPLGATMRNGTTWFDRTNYFQNVPKTALDTLLWLESDRMGHLLGAVSQEKLDEQRGVVQNEKRQGENEPYGRSEQIILRHIYPVGHPYSWETIGSMEDLNAATLDDVHAWFKQYYGAANAVLCIGGDVDPEEIKTKVEKYFGAIPSGPPVTALETWIPRRTGTTHLTHQDRVPHDRLYFVWNTPQFGASDANYLQLLTTILGSGKTSRLHKKLVREEGLALDVSNWTMPFEIAGMFQLEITLKEGTDPKKVETIVQHEIQNLIKNGPSKDEVARAVNQQLREVLRASQGIGGFGGKTETLARGETYLGNADYYKTQLQEWREATPDHISKAAARWLNDGLFLMHIKPFPKYQTSQTDADRSKMPEPGPVPHVSFPTIEKARLDNGLNIVLIQRDTVPIVDFRLLVDDGNAAELLAGKPGIRNLTIEMLSEGSGDMDSIEVSETLTRLGAEFFGYTRPDQSILEIHTMKANLKESLDLFTKIVTKPTFNGEELERTREQVLSSFQQSRLSPFGIASTVLPKVLYGENHPYALPVSGNGYENVVRELTTADLVEYHNTWFRPNNATLLVVGDITMAEVKSVLGKTLGSWKKAEVPTIEKPGHVNPSGGKIYLVHRPDSPQSLIVGATVIDPITQDTYFGYQIFNDLLGGTFISRLNMNLREDKHWSYGASSNRFPAINNMRGQRPFMVAAPVQSDKTAESLKEMIRELKEILGERPVTDEEWDRAKSTNIKQLPGSWENTGSLLYALDVLVAKGYDQDFYQNYSEKFEKANIKDLAKHIPSWVDPSGYNWIVIGDADRIGEALEAIEGLEIVPIDADGNLRAQGS